MLSAEQRARLGQVIVRHRIKEYGMPPVLAVLARDLDLSSEQHEKHAKMYGRRAEKVLEHLTGGDSLQDVRRDVFLTNQEYVERFEEMLSEAQRAKLKSLLGEPLTVEVKFNDRGNFREPKEQAKQPAAQMPSTDLKQITFASLLLGNAQRLNLTKEQIARFREIADEAPKLRVILHKELSQLPSPTETGGNRASLPEVRALQSLRKAVEEQCVGLLDMQQLSILRDITHRNEAPFDP